MAKNYKNTVMTEKENEKAGAIPEYNQNAQAGDCRTELNSASQFERVPSIDRFRGFCILLMVGSVLLGMFGDTFSAIGGLFLHGADGWQLVVGNASFVGEGYSGIAFADIFAPLFIFVIGLTFCGSFRLREQSSGAGVAYFRLAVRYLALIGFGASVDGFSTLPDVFSGKWAELRLSDRIFSVAALILVATLILMLAGVFVKKGRFKKLSVEIFRYAAAVLGILALFLALCSLGEKIGEAFGRQTLYEGSKYGGFVWDTLQNIGLAGLLALPFVKFGKWGRLAVVGVFYAAVTVVYQHNGFAISQWALEGGLVGGIGWAGILLLGSVFRDLKEENFRLTFWILSASLVVVSVILISFLGFIAAKRGGTPVYCMFCAGLGGMIWGLFSFLDNWHPRFDLLAWWGGSCFLTYVLTLAFGFAIEAAAGSGTPIWLALIIGIGWYAVMTVMNWLLSRKGKYVKI